MSDLFQNYMELQRKAIIERLNAAPREHKAAWRKALRDHTTKMLEAENGQTQKVAA